MQPAGVLSAAPDVALGVAFLVTWIVPRWMGVDWLRYAMLTMLLEFIVIHSAGLMGAVMLDGSSRSFRTVKVIGLALVYTVLVWTFTVIFEERWPLLAFWSLTLNRLTGVLLHTAPPGEERERLMRGWVTSGVLYILWMIATALLPLPRLGLSPGIVADAQLPGAGAWVESPQRLMAAGAGYFLSQAYFELSESRKGAHD
jgi:hypothetical protein